MQTEALGTGASGCTGWDVLGSFCLWVQSRWKCHENKGSFLPTKYVKSIILNFEKFFIPYSISHFIE